MLKTTDFHKNVYIDGNILFDTERVPLYIDLHTFRNIDDHKWDRVIKPDKEIDDNGAPFHYVNSDSICDEATVYYSKGDVTDMTENIYESNNPYRCIYSYNQNVVDLNSFLSVELEHNHQAIRSRMIYLSILSNYELFMMDLFWTCYQRFPELKENYHKRRRFNGCTEDEVFEKLNEVPYNDFEEVCSLLSTLLGVRISEPPELIKAYKRRNDIAHRYNRTKEGNMIVIPNEKLIDLVTHTNKFVYESFKGVIKTVYKTHN